MKNLIARLRVPVKLFFNDLCQDSLKAVSSVDSLLLSSLTLSEISCSQGSFLQTNHDNINDSASFHEPYHVKKKGGNRKLIKNMIFSMEGLGSKLK